jgi:YVTN family beta-propeller protein
VSVSADPRIGSELAGYLIEALVGRGGMGVVYRAHDRALDRKVALKILSPELAADVGFRERFLIESRLAAALDHPSVIPVYDAGEAAGELYIAMRFVEGSDLRQLLQAGALTPERTIALVSQVAEALDAAHTRGLVHRDVKPANVLVAEADHVYLADFGLTRRMGAAPGQLGAGRSLGTSDYVAPEQIRGEEVDGRADVYSLGCLLYECLIGRPPFQRDSEIAVVYAHLEEVPPKPSVRRPELPEEIDEVVARAMAKRPSERYATCTQLVDAARTALGLSDHVERPVRGHRGGAYATAWLVAAVAIGVTALLAFLLTGGGGGPHAAGAIDAIDPATNRVAQTVQLADPVSAVGASDAGVWAASLRNDALWRIDPRGRAPIRVELMGAPQDVAVHGGTAYVAAEGPRFGSGNLTSYGAANGNRLNGIEAIAYDLAAGRNGVWTAGWLAVDHVTVGARLGIRATVPIPTRFPLDASHDREVLNDLALGNGRLWVIGDAADRRLWEINPRLHRIVKTITLPFAPARVAAGAGSVWVTEQLDDAVARIDPMTGKVVRSIPIGRGAGAIAVGAGSVWAASFIDDTVSRIDPRSNRVVATIRVAGSPTDIAFANGLVWVGVDAS